MKKPLVGAFLVTLMVPVLASAQSDKSVHVNIGGGFTTPLSEVSERFSTGGGFNFGVIFAPPTSAVGFQVEYAYNALGGEDKFIPLYASPTATVAGETLIESHHAMHYIDFNAIFKPTGDSKVKPYGIGGFGVYYRSVSLTTPDVGYTTWCDPVLVRLLPDPGRDRSRYR